MQLTEHISAEALERYEAGKSAPAETLAVQRHIAACAACREKFAEAFDTNKSVAALRGDFSFDDFEPAPEHLPYERLALFAEGKLDAVEREIAESHFAVCAECAKDLDDLRVYQKIAAAPISANETAVKTALETVERKTFWQRLFAFDSIGGFAPVAAVLLVAVSVGGWFFVRSNQTNREIAQTNINQTAPPAPAAALSPDFNRAGTNVNSPPESNAQNNQNAAAPIKQSETFLALSDGRITVEQNGAINGLETLSAAAQKSVRQTLQSGKVPVSPAADSLGGNAGILMSGGKESSGVPFALETPVARVVRDAQPVLRWKPLKDATAYNVTIVDDKFRVVAESGKQSQTSWKPPKPLPGGANYSWQVTATRADGTETISPSAPAPQARFRVVEQTLIEEISRLEKSKPRSHLALGTLYAQAGLRQETRREFQALVKQNPNSALARKLLAGVR